MGVFGLPGWLTNKVGIATVEGLSLFGAAVGATSYASAQTLKDQTPVTATLDGVQQDSPSKVVKFVPGTELTRSELPDSKLTSFGKSMNIPFLGDAQSLSSKVGTVIVGKTKRVKESDELIAGDSIRSELTKKAKEAGKPVTWILSGGGVKPSARVGMTIPAGPVTVSVRFSAEGKIHYVVLAPYELDASEAKRFAKNATVDLPVSAQKAKDLSPGMSVMFSGSGQLAASLNVGAALDVPVFGGSLGKYLVPSGSAGASIYRAVDGALAIRVDRLGGDYVKAVFSMMNGSTGQESGGVEFGVNANFDSLIPVFGTDRLLKEGRKLTVREVERRIERWMSSQLRMWVTTSKGERHAYSRIFDLSDPAQRDAYDTLFSNPVARTPNVGTHLDEHSRARESKLGWRAGVVDVLRWTTRQEEAHGAVTSKNGNYTYDRTVLYDGLEHILSVLFGSIQTRRELVTLTPEGHGPDSYYHVEYSMKKDRVTTKDDVSKFRRFANFVGALGPDGRAIAEDARVGDISWQTNRRISLFFNNEALKKLTEASDAEVIQAHADAFNELEEPWDLGYLFGETASKKTPWLNTKHPDYARIMELLELGSETGGMTGDSAPTRSEEYRALTGGRNLLIDSSGYKEGQRFLAIVKELRNTANDPAKRIRLFARHDYDSTIGNSWTEMAAIAKIAGPENTIIGRLEIEGKKGKSLVYKQENGAWSLDWNLRTAIENP